MTGLVLLAACASRGVSTTDADEAAAVAAGATPVTVANNGGLSAGAATIFVLPQVGARIQLGTVSPGGSRTFALEATPGSYRLLAAFVTGNERRSETFRVYADASVRWDMATNRVVVGRR
jgi:hypothetical protein